MPTPGNRDGLLIHKEAHMRLYETVFILKPDLTEEENQTWIQRILQVIEQNKGELIRLDEWGTKTLAYKIRKFSKGYYVYAVFRGDDTCIGELDRHFKMLEPFIRHIIVKLDDRELDKHRQAQQDKTAREQAEQPAETEKKDVLSETPTSESAETAESQLSPESKSKPTEEVPA